jgi:hypothetical protein
MNYEDEIDEIIDMDPGDREQAIEDLKKKISDDDQDDGFLRSSSAASAGFFLGGW